MRCDLVRGLAFAIVHRPSCRAARRRKQKDGHATITGRRGVVAVAAEIVSDACSNDDWEEAPRDGEAVRELLARFFAPDDLPVELRPRTVEESTTQLTSGRKSVA